jgi:hypothetical protein
MLREIFRPRARALLAAVLMFAGAIFHAQAHAQATNNPQQLLNEVHTIASPTVGVPIEHSFDVSVAGTYQITLQDLGAALNPPAPLTSVKLAITSGSTLVPLTVAGATATLLSGAGTAQFTAAVGTYIIHVVGVPGTITPTNGTASPNPLSGPISIQVAAAGGSTNLASFSDTLAPAYTGFPGNENTLDDTLTVASSGNYVVTLTDLSLPQPLTTLSLVIETQVGTFITNPPLATTPPGVTASSQTVALQQGTTYDVFALGVSDPTVSAGLFSVTVSPAGGGAPVYARVVTVGAVAPIDSVALNAGGSYTLSLADLSYPSPLSSLGALAVVNGQVAAQLTAVGTSTPFASIAGTYQIYALPVTTSPGSYSITLAPQSGPPALSVARAVSAPGGTVQTAYSFDTTVTTAGSYSLDLADFAVPAKFSSLSAAAVQNGALLGSALTAAGTQSVTVAAGPVSVLVFAQPAASGSLFGADLTAGGGADPVFETTQGVGQLFSGRQVAVTTAGTYGVTISDVGFPASLTTYAAVVTRGTTQLGSIVGFGTFTFPATPGNYFVNFIAQPGGTDLAGTYSLNVTQAPSILLTPSATTVVSGGTVNIQWSSDYATSCTASSTATGSTTASGGWSGTQNTSGTFTSTALTASTTFTLACTGAGGNVSQSVNVMVAVPSNPPSSTGSSHSGGGSLSTDLLLLLAAMVLLRRLVVVASATRD